MAWIKVEDNLPDTCYQHGCVWESDEVLLDCGDFYYVSRYIREYDKITYDLIKEYFKDIEDSSIVEKWMEISK